MGTCMIVSCLTHLRVTRKQARAEKKDPPLNAGNDGVGVGSLLGSLVELSDNDNLLSGLSTSEDDGDLSWLVDWRWGQYWCAGYELIHAWSGLGFRMSGNFRCSVPSTCLLSSHPTATLAARTDEPNGEPAQHIEEQCGLVLPRSSSLISTVISPVSISSFNVFLPIFSNAAACPRHPEPNPSPSVVVYEDTHL